jgi:hypothetical protein
MKPRALALAVALAQALLGAACARRPPLEQLFVDLEREIEKRDAAAVLDHLAPEFRTESGTTRAQVADDLKRYFFAYESLDVAFSELTPHAPLAISVRVDMSGRPKQIGGLAGLFPEVAAYRFDLDLVERDGKLLVAGGRWEPIDRSAR